MRLIHTESLELYEHSEHTQRGDSLPPYAVLSHTWLDDGPEGVKEVVYQDMKNSFLALSHGRLKPEGWSKLTHFCARARQDGWEWVWMDTCCIDKTNTGDTQEAINAMFRWYRAAAVCYAYLADVGDTGKKPDPAKAAYSRSRHLNLPLPSAGSPTASQHPTSTNPDSRSTTPDLPSPSLEHDRNKINRQFRESKWFTRGWTLQELLAPRYLIFVDCHWQQIGTRENWAVEIEKQCRIEARFLVDFEPADTLSCCLAKRLSWAASRKTTIEEDETYSLLGLFGISLPLVYGEGRLLAFTRFQQELMRYYDDDSILAWEAVLNEGDLYTGVPLDRQVGKMVAPVLAPSIHFFKNASNMSRLPGHNESFFMTNKGLKITGSLSTVKLDFSRKIDFNPAFTMTVALDPEWSAGFTSDFSRPYPHEPTHCLFLNSTDIVGEGALSIKRIGIPISFNNLGFYQRCDDRLIYSYLSERRDETREKLKYECTYSACASDVSSDETRRKQPAPSTGRTWLSDLENDKTITISSNYSSNQEHSESSLRFLAYRPNVQVEYPKTRARIVMIYYCYAFQGRYSCDRLRQPNGEFKSLHLSSPIPMLQGVVYCIELRVPGLTPARLVVIMSHTSHATLLASIHKRDHVNLAIGQRDAQINNKPGMTEQEICGGVVRIQVRPHQLLAQPERTPIPLRYLAYTLDIAVVDVV